MNTTNTIMSKEKPITSKPIPVGLILGVSAGIALALCWSLAPAAHAQTQAPTNIAQPNKTFDVFVGQNKPGPYELSWQKIVADEMKVIVDGATLDPSAYAVDAEKGAITFKNALKNGVVVRVDYGYFPQTAIRNTKPASVPITVPLLRFNEQTSLQVTALPSSGVAGDKKGDSKSQQSAPQGLDKPLLVVNLGGKTDFLGGGLTTSAYLAPDTPEPDEHGTFTDRLAMNLGYKVGNDKNGLDALFLRTGSEFATNVGKTFKLGDATQQWGFGGRYAVASWLGAKYSTKEVRDLTGKGSTGRSDMALNLGGVGAVPALNLARTEDVKTSDKDESTRVTTDKVDLAAKVGGATEFKALTRTTATDAHDDKKDLTAKESALALSTKVGNVAEVTAKGQILDTKASDDKLDKTAQEGTISVSAATKDKTAQLSVAVTTGKTETTTSVEQKQGVSVTLQPAPALKLTAEQKQQTLTLIPTESAADSKKEDAKTAADALKPKETTIQSAKAEVTPLRGTILTGTYQMNEDGTKKVSTTDVNAELGKGAFLSIAGGITDRRTTDDKSGVLDTTRAKVALKPLSGLTFSGGMVINPADDKGKVTEARRQEVGLSARVGTFELGGGYAITTPGGMEDAMDQAQAGELSLLLGLRFNRFARLDGSVKNSFLYGADEPGGLRVYTLGFTHELGSALNFSFGGKMTEDTSKVERPLDATAEAKFNLKF